MLREDSANVSCNFILQYHAPSRPRENITIREIRPTCLIPSYDFILPKDNVFLGDGILIWSLYNIFDYVGVHDMEAMLRIIYDSK